jgi:hypothetical protein
MGGLFTVVTVRDRLNSYEEDPGWYQHPAGTGALKATDDELRRDGIDVSRLTLNGGKKSTAMMAINREDSPMFLSRFVMVPVFFLISFHPAVAALAAQEHSHEGPHGGIVAEADGMYLEFVVDKNGEPSLYVYAKGMKPVAWPGLEANLTVKGRNSVEHSRLRASKDSQGIFVLKGRSAIKALEDWDTAVVSLKLKDTWTDVRFSRHSGAMAGH